MAREDLLTFLRSQPAAVLADVLAELAADHDEVRKRLERMQLAKSPAKLSASFGKQLAAWKRSRRFWSKTLSTSPGCAWASSP